MMVAHAVTRRCSRRRAFRLATLVGVVCASLCALAPLSLVSASSRTVTPSLVAAYADSSSDIMQAAEVAYSMEETISLSNSKMSVIDATLSLYGSSPTTDYIVIAQEPNIVYSSSTYNLVEENSMGITSFPVGGLAVVPIYNLPGRTKKLILTRINLAYIMRGEITRWDDSRLAELNDDLPSEDIIMVLPVTKLAQTFALTRALVKFDSNWTTEVGAASDVISWPLENYAAYELFNISTSMASYTLATDYTFSYANLANALRLSATTAYMVNQAGQTVAATTMSIKDAILDVGGYYDDSGDLQWQMDLTDGTGYGSWPISFMFACFLPVSYSRSTCLARTEITSFWLWFYASTTVADLAAEIGVALLPAISYTNFGVDTMLRSTIKCEGNSVADASTVSIEYYGVSIASYGSRIDSNLMGFYGATDPNHTYSLTIIDELRAVQQVEAREIDGAFIAADQFRVIHEDVLEPYVYSVEDAEKGLDTGDLLVLPYSLFAIVPVFNLPTAVATAYASSLPLVVDMALLGRLFTANLTSWTDPDMETLNPGLTAAFTSTGSSTNITLVVCCGDGVASPVTNAFVAALNVSSTFFANFTTWTLPVDWTEMETVASSTNLTVLHVDKELQLESAVNRIEGAIGYRLNYNNTAETSTKFAIRRTTLAGTLFYSDSSKATVTTLTATTASLLPCINAVTPSVDIDYTVSNIVPTSSQVSTYSQCWPITVMKSVVIPATYTTDYCSAGLAALDLAVFLVTNDTLYDAVTSRAIVRFSNISAMATLQTAALNAATCEGTTMLITLDTVWTLSTAITSLGWALMAIGILLVLVSVGILAKYRHRAVLRSSSVPFQFVILFGLALLFVSIGIFGMKPSTTNCQSLAWLINIGFTLTFGPLFAKMWRIYKIFDRRVLRVVKISNEKLGMIVAGLVLIDIIVNSAWQAVSPVYSAAQLHTSNGVIWSYDQCTGDNETLPFLIVVLAEKCLMLVFGSFMGFTTRNVSSTFNESKNVAWAIYNVFFTGAIIILVLIFSGVRGDSFVILIVLLIAWISFCTFALNFVSKFIVLYRGEETANGSMSNAGGGGGMASNDGLGSAQLFSFVPLISVPKAILDRYIAALELQMRTAKERHQALIEDGGQGGNGFGPQYSQHHTQGGRDGMRRDASQSGFGLTKRSRGGGGGASKERSRELSRDFGSPTGGGAADSYRVLSSGGGDEPDSTLELPPPQPRTPLGLTPTATAERGHANRISSLRPHRPSMSTGGGAESDTLHITSSTPLKASSRAGPGSGLVVHVDLDADVSDSTSPPGAAAASAASVAVAEPSSNSGGGGGVADPPTSSSPNQTTWVPQNDEVALIAPVDADEL